MNSSSLWSAYARMLLWTTALALADVLLSATLCLWFTGGWPLTRSGYQGLGLTLVLILAGQSAVFWLREAMVRKAGKR